MNGPFIPAARAAADRTGPGEIPASRRSPLPKTAETVEAS